MAAAESPGDIGPSPRIRLRVESLSDLVFGLALSIGSVFLVDRAPQTGEDLAVNVLLFGFGFIIVVLTWLGYSRVMAVLPEEAPFALVANVALLFVVALEPYLFYVLETSGSNALANASSVAYALDLGGLFLIQGALSRVVVGRSQIQSGGKGAIHPVVVARFRRWMKVDFFIGSVFVVSSLPVFWVDTPLGHLRFVTWSATFVVFGAGRARDRQKEKG